MKTQILKMTCIGYIGILAMLGCNNSIQDKEAKVQDATANLDSAKKELNRALIDSANEVAKDEDTLSADNIRITTLKDKWENGEIKADSSYHNDLRRLDEDNKKLQAKLKEYKNEGKEKWGTFRHDFNKDVDTLGKRISRLGEKNEK